jgi:hypothetical protein
VTNKEKFSQPTTVVFGRIQNNGCILRAEDIKHKSHLKQKHNERKLYDWETAIAIDVIDCDN